MVVAFTTFIRVDINCICGCGRWLFEQRFCRFDFGGRLGLGLALTWFPWSSSGIYCPRCPRVFSAIPRFGVRGMSRARALVEERESWAQEQTRKREKMPAEKIHTYSTIQQLVALLLLLSKPSNGPMTILIDTLVPPKTFAFAAQRCTKA